MATLELLEFFKVAILGSATKMLGDRRTPYEVTVVGTTYDVSNVIADNYSTATIWTSGAGGVTTFKILLFMSDADVFIELANTVPVPDERAILFVRANTIVVLTGNMVGGYASDTSRLDGAVMVEATDFDDITEIRVQRNAEDAAGDATTRLVLIN